MSNDCGGHIVWVRSGLLTYYVGTQKPALDHMSKHTICHAAEREAGLLSGENMSKKSDLVGLRLSDPPLLNGYTKKCRNQEIQLLIIGS